MYKNPAIEAVIRGQWFMKGRSDLRAYNRMVSDKSISLEVFALAATVVREMKCLVRKLSDSTALGRLSSACKSGPTGTSAVYSSPMTSVDVRKYLFSVSPWLIHTYLVF